MKYGASASRERARGGPTSKKTDSENPREWGDGDEKEGQGHYYE